MPADACSAALSAGVILVLAAVPAVADPAGAVPRGECRVVDVAFQPMQRTDLSPGVNPPPQIVMWIEDTSGVYVDTVFITKQTGTYGMGNRPGRYDLNSGPLWPYGRRITTFPVWSHKHGLEYPEVVFQSGLDYNVSHSAGESSADLHYCRPMQQVEPAWDALTCATGFVGTDKGKLDPIRRSKYPPRQDLMRDPLRDSSEIEMYGMLNTFDAVSQATPVAGAIADVSWPSVNVLLPGNYVLWAEVAKEFDHNTTYSETAFPSPTGIPWTEYGVAYRGQPSVLYKVPFTVEAGTTVASTADYVGYSDPDGLDGNIRAPDATISTTQPGSGALRFALVADNGGGMFRVKVTSRPELDYDVPGAPSNMDVADSANNTATITFVAPGDDGAVGKVTGYEIRYRVTESITDANFDEFGSVDPKLSMEIGAPGDIQTFMLPGLLPATEYSVGIRAYDDCRNTSELTVLTFKTPDRTSGEVDACFIATAAYGSPLAADVQMLRGVRDSVLRKSVLGELAIETYYTFGPALAGVIGESELLRATAREWLAPIVRYARALTR